MPTVHLRFYASLREHFERPALMQVFELGASVGQVVDDVVPHRLRNGLRCAVNEDFVEMNRVLQDGDIVDLLPPFGGG